MLRERPAQTLPGGWMVVVLFVLMIAFTAGIVFRHARRPRSGSCCRRSPWCSR